MKNGLAKLIEVLPWLCANPGVSAKETANQFGLSQKELLDLLQLAVVTGPGQGGGELVDIDFEDEDSLCVLDAKGLERPIQFTVETSMQIIGGLNYLMQLPGAINSSELESLLLKLQSAFKVDNQPIEIVPNDEAKILIQVTNQAISENKCLEIEYVSVSTGQVSRRTIEPKLLIAGNDQIHLKAWCNAALDFRLFRLDRIKEFKLIERPQHEREIPQETPLQGVITVELDCINYLAIEFDPRIIKASNPTSDGRTLLTIGVHDLNWIAGEILASEGRIKAVSPPELIDLLNLKIANWRALNTA
jgi:proteasome accessory factor C